MRATLWGLHKTQIGIEQGAPRETTCTAAPGKRGAYDSSEDGDDQYFAATWPQKSNILNTSDFVGIPDAGVWSAAAEAGFQCDTRQLSSGDETDTCEEFFLEVTLAHLERSVR